MLNFGALLSDNFLLQKIEPRFLYCDEISEEKSTGISKRKYKLAAIKNDILLSIGIYQFFVLTTNFDACKKDFTVTCNPRDWEEISDQFKRQVGVKTSYLDCTKIESLNKNDILSKMKDGKNKFVIAGKLKFKKFQEFTRLSLNKLERSHKQISSEKTKSIIQGLTPQDEALTLLKKLNLA